MLDFLWRAFLEQLKIYICLFVLFADVLLVFECFFSDLEGLIFCLLWDIFVASFFASIFDRLESDLEVISGGFREPNL